MAKISSEISIQAFDFRKNQSLNDVEPINCKSLLLKLNVLTVYRPLSDDFSGMCLRKGDLMFILLNSNHSRGKQHFTIAHEFYHLYCQEDFKPHACNPGNTKGVDTNEKLADAFASEFLLPEMGIKKMIPLKELDKKEISISTILVLENYFSVSHSALLIRLRGLDLITSIQYDSFSNLRIKQTAKEYGFGLSLYEPGNEGLVIGDYGIKAKQLFSDLKISESHYYELMNSIGIDPTTDTDE
jgi:Zn-dependent peptidase ImmA (M78 family)